MAISLSTGLKNKMLDTILNGAAGTNFDLAILEIRTGAAPGPNAAASGTVLATITCPADAFAAASSGAAAKSGTWQDTSADASGTAQHFRLRQAGDDNSSDATKLRIEGSVTVTAGGGDMSVDNTSINIAQQVTVTAFTVSIS